MTTYEMVTSAEFGRPIQSTIVSGECSFDATLFVASLELLELTQGQIISYHGQLPGVHFVASIAIHHWCPDFGLLHCHLPIYFLSVRSMQKCKQLRSHCCVSHALLLCFATDVALPGAGRGPSRPQHGHPDRQGTAQRAARQRPATDRCGHERCLRQKHRAAHPSFSKFAPTPPRCFSSYTF